MTEILGEGLEMQVQGAILFPPSGVTVEALTVTANGTYTAPAGKAYSPVTVNVPQGGGVEPQEFVWDQIPTPVANYLDDVTYDPTDYTTSQIANYAPAVADIENSKPGGKTVNVKEGVLNRNGYQQAVEAGAVTLYNDIPFARTPYTVTKNGVVLDAGTLTPSGGFLRQLNCPTAVNVRDLGGWSCDGGTVRYGLLIRGGEPTAQDAAVLVDECGVKFEMNLRGRSEAEREYSVLGNIGYSVYDSYAWYSIADATLWRQMMQTVFDCINNSIPIYFHCSAGADRTGTLACVLEALLGMSQSDVDKDYELTCFYTGTDTDAHGRRRDESEWRGLIDQINAKEGASFRDKAVSFVLSLGFSISEINRFRAVMIDGTPEILVGKNYTVTNALTGVTSSNTAQSAEEYQPYTAALAPDSGKLIDSVIVTMGGADITGQVFSGTSAERKVRITYSLSHCSTDNQRGFAVVGAAYAATLTADENYTLNGAAVSVTMGGTDVSQYYSNGTINIPSVTGDIVITATAVESAEPTIAVHWNSGYNCSYTAGQSIEMTAGASYAVTDLIPVTAGKTYTVKVDGIEKLNSFRFVGADSSGIVTESVSIPDLTQAIATFTPASGTTQMRLRGYSGGINLQNLVLTEE